MYSDVFCKVYNEFGWNYYPEAFGEQLLQWLSDHNVSVGSAMDLACGTGVLCRILKEQGIRAHGMDFSTGMIAIAREADPDIPYDVADMTTYRPEAQFDLVTCTGDALNHIPDLADVERIFANVHAYLAPGGHFIFDLLDEKEISTSEPFDLDFDEHIRARFRITRPAADKVHLQTEVFEDGVHSFTEDIFETVHDRSAVLSMLQRQGFELLKCAHRLSDDGGPEVATWFVIARKSDNTAQRNKITEVLL
ncbi:MAG: class I SAM-dependent methyltransferase [Oscillospiraceae bacterium]|nr:class I SAM-dependent methyltransferase [Oscillospiraceae bacterium]